MHGILAANMRASDQDATDLRQVGVGISLVLCFHGVGPKCCGGIVGLGSGLSGVGSSTAGRCALQLTWRSCWHCEFGLDGAVDGLRDFLGGA